MHESASDHHPEHPLTQGDFVLLDASLAWETVTSALKELQHQRNTDETTNLLSGKGLEIALGNVFKENPYARVLLFEDDLGNFKTMNDAKGHDFGDQVLRLYAEVKQSLLRASDLQSHDARLQGDEFLSAFILGSTVSDEEIPGIIASLQERMHTIPAAMREVMPVLGAFPSFNVASGGVEYDPTKTFADNRQLADIEMYMDKSNQRRIYGADRRPTSEVPIMSQAQ